MIDEGGPAGGQARIHRTFLPQDQIAVPISVKLTSTNQTAIYTALSNKNVVTAARKIYIANVSSSAANVTMSWTDSSASTTYTLLGTKAVAANDTLVETLDFIIRDGDSINCTAGTANALHVTLLITERGKISA